MTTTTTTKAPVRPVTGKGKGTTAPKSQATGPDVSAIPAADVAAALDAVTAAKLATDKQEAAAIAKLVKAFKAGAGSVDRKAKQVASIQDAIALVRVNMVRTAHELTKYPASYAAKGTYAGKPAPGVIAGMVGMPAATFQPYWKALAALTAKEWHERTAEPSADEIALVRSFWETDAAKKKAERAANSSTGGGGTDAPEDGGESAPTLGKGVELPAPTQGDVLAAAKAFRDMAVLFARDGGFDRATADAIEDLMGEVGAVLTEHTI